MNIMRSDFPEVQELDLIKVSLLKGYFHYNRSNINVSADRKISYDFMWRAGIV
jgi:hypothetical protein